MNQDIMSEPSLSDKTNSLNQSGAFLQIHILKQLTDHRWTANPEYPVTVSPFISEPKKQQIIDARFRSGATFVDPTTFVTAIQESLSKSEVKETSIDVVGFKTIGSGDFYLCIEAKKLNPQYIDWVFFKQEVKSDVMNLILHTYDSKAIVQLFTTVPTNLFVANTYYEIRNADDWKPTKHEVTDFTVALTNSKISGEYFKSEKTIIDQAARQIIEGTYGFILDKIIENIQKGEKVVSDNGNEIFIPIIVTNANLYICDFDQKDIDSISGHIRKDPIFRKVDSVIYECATPKTVQFPNPLSSNLSLEQRKALKKWHVLILSPKGLDDFLKAMNAQNC